MKRMQQALSVLALGTALALPGGAQAAEKTIAFMRGGPIPITNTA